ncbi:branched-chain amino acid aminotransferase [Pendulispora albinea]|uniref:Branched-chain-amino-acid aminotransferase n=1 Tax=Pendulispora albinea TaxID=2741071 RepID=A0ABZ2M5M6_9BACT
MTSSLSFSKIPHPQPTSAERLAEILAKPGFGRHFTDHMVTIRWNESQGWHDAKVEAHRPLELSPSASVLHYGQAIFEGLKAYRQPDKSIATFRPLANAERFRASARRMAMPELPDDLFLGSLRELVAIDTRWVPDANEESLYFRPFMIATEASLGVRPSKEYLYVLIASPAGAYFSGGLKPVSVWLCTEYVRAAPGGTGAAKFAGNYAASLLAQAQAAERGCDQVVWLDAIERRWIEEMGGMNLFFVFGSGKSAKVVTPELTGALLPGVTRSSILRLASDLGYGAEERRISTDEWKQKTASGELTEVFACGTAAVVTPVGRAKHAGGEFTIGTGDTGKVTAHIRERLTSIQRGTSPDPHNWIHQLLPPR